MLNKDSKYEWRQNIFRTIKPFYNDKIGKFTHQKISEDWHFRGLAFVRDDMTYVFGFNIGFFRKDTKLPDFEFEYVGMNVLVRTNGLNPGLRNKYKEFFEFHLSKWIIDNPGIYTSFRGDIGIELPRLRKISDFNNEQEIVDFLKDGISRFSEVWPYIASNPENIFSHVVRGNPPWDEAIIELALKKAANIYKP